ncbi:putative terminase small subunit [Vibrio phage 1.072.O._10N.286.48.A12]|nr:putative terminase small subunit [Vibrio phage 1.056.O._10N.261.48.C11]AUR84961.1 putative terminase small subunit [Vibrio phage 1.066.O._10N.286.46.E8]AUR85092.1 putative terminase small subunit [Vibrio phage 1.068.O._10N.261.51.F8]AUR85319.1 putative terminase small subunit [Vibrio phage 1.072.O._10N.286.48.A12]
MRKLTPVEKNPPRCVTKFVSPIEAIEMYRMLFKDISEGGVEIQYNDRHALGQLAVMTLEVEILTNQLYEIGDAMEVNGDKGNIVTKKNPARDALEKVRPKMIQMMKEFKMTPASRGTKSTGGSGGSELDDEFNQM